MILYHFCATFSEDRILSEGIRLGQFAYFHDGHYQFIPKCQWLTKDPDPKNQSWATQHLIDYGRTAYRMTVNIPQSHHKKLIPAADFVRNMPDEAKSVIYGWPGSENWYIFRGDIPAKWIVGCKKFDK